MLRKVILRNCKFDSFNLKRSDRNQRNFCCNMSTNSKFLEKSKTDLTDIFFAGVKAVLPKAIIENKIKLQDRILNIQDKKFNLQENVYLIGFGKAVKGMAIALERILGNNLKRGIVSIPKLSKDTIWSYEDTSNFPNIINSKIDYRESAINNQPDNRSLETTHDIIDLVESLTEADTLIVLVSGGGSALLYMPRPVIDPDDKMQLCKTLQNAGADITELNTVRKKLSLVKGGGLARMAYPASVITLILSDIVGDPIDLIASGPTVYSDKAPEEIVAILKKYNLYKTLQGDLKTVITSKETFNDKPLLNRAKEFKHVDNIILGNNMMAIEAASIEALRKKLTPIILRNDVKGHVRDVSLAYVHVASLICLALENLLTREEFFERIKDISILPLPLNKVDEIYKLIENINREGLVLIGGGEPTVVVKGKGKGGRNQELALYFSLDWLAKINSNPIFAEYDVLMLSGGTDGQDGPTDAAGAFGYPAIGPIIHNLHMKLKMMITQKLIQIGSDKVKNDVTEPVKDLCKRQELSGFVTSNIVQEHQFITDKIQEKESFDLVDTDNVPDSSVQSLELKVMEVERMLPENVLRENDSYNFYSRFKKGIDLLKTGFTDTNVMDLHLIYIKKRECTCKIDFPKEQLSEIEDILSAHDIHIDPTTIEKYKTMHASSTFAKDETLCKDPFTLHYKEEQELNIKIIDENLADPCCNKQRKLPIDT